jgi:RNase P protein component
VPSVHKTVSLVSKETENTAENTASVDASDNSTSRGAGTGTVDGLTLAAKRSRSAAKRNAVKVRIDEYFTSLLQCLRCTPLLTITVVFVSGQVRVRTI